MSAPAVTVTGLRELESLVGTAIPPSPWQQVGREAIVQFDAATFHEPSTNYPGAAESQAAHGTHALALLMAPQDSTIAIRGFDRIVLLGFDRVRCPAPLEVGARVRAHYAITSVVADAGGARCILSATLEREGEETPVCVADAVLRLLT